MATSGAMIRGIAHAIARPEPTVTSYYGALRKAGLISTTGRGRGAQDLSPLDVARILIVMLSADALQEAAFKTRLIGGMPFSPTNGIDERFKNVNFEKAVASLIDCKSSGFAELPEGNDCLFRGKLESEYTISVNSTHLYGEIVCEGGYIKFQYKDIDEIRKCSGIEYENVEEIIFVIRSTMEGMSVTKSISNGIINRIARINAIGERYLTAQNHQPL